MSNIYKELKEKQETEFNSFPIKFAFSRQQEEKGLEELGLASADEAIGIGGGGFIRESDKQAFYDMGAAKRVKFGDADCILGEAKKIFEVCKKLFSIEENCVIDRETIPEEWWK